MLERFLVDASGPARHQHAYDASHSILSIAHASLERGARPDVRAKLLEFSRANAAWLLSDAVHAALCTQRNAGFRAWPERDRELWIYNDLARLQELIAEHESAIDRYAFGQLLVHDEHERIRRSCGLSLYGDMQVGYSDADAWRFADVFLPGYLMGAPPSRTNPEGQPWGYPVLDPAGYDGPAKALVVARAEKAFAEYDKAAHRSSARPRLPVGLSHRHGRRRASRPRRRAPVRVTGSSRSSEDRDVRDRAARSDPARKAALHEDWGPGPQGNDRT